MRTKGFLLIVSGIAFILFAASISFGATIMLPKTGQSQCYDSDGFVIGCAGTGQDGAIKAGDIWASPRFSVSGDCVTDNLTGLMWVKDANRFGAKNWADAVSDANGLDLCGKTDWRLPNINELESLFNAGYNEELCDDVACVNYFDWLESKGFENVQDSYWSSTTKANNTDYASYVYMYDGFVGNNSKTGVSLGVWPVRGLSTTLWKTGQAISYADGDDGYHEKGVSWPSPRFTITYCDANGPCNDQSVDCDAITTNDVVTDNLTGLMWARDAFRFGNNRTWQQALDDSNSLSLCGYTDWRLPNRKEYISLVDQSQSVEPSLPTGHPFINVQSWYYWSSTTRVYLSTSKAWRVSVQYGYVVSGDYKSSGSCVWPVREGLCGSKTVKVGNAAAAYDSIQDGYDAAASGQTIRAQAVTFGEALVFTVDKAVVLTGGHNCGFTAQVGSTTVGGSLKIVKGTVTLDKFIIK
jgi:hypothetical protein